jgi:DNA helicase-2/ATP-dependent DNA helicase PcrA
MIEDKKVWVEETAYLARVMNEIKSQLDIGINAAQNYKNDAIELQKSMWEDLRLAPTSLFDLEDVAQINQIQMELNNKASIYKFSYEKVGSLKRLYKNPYFGRIDFLEQGEKSAEKIYIGMSSLSTDDTMDMLIYDWRAPISSMFYDFETGPASYSCPAGLIEGQMLLKRQYKIENSDIVYMFDSSLSINDSMLQEILGKSTDNRMRTIVTSIQKEQNTVIRNSQNRVLIVEGPAGSGKTSIALHRAAYLLYRYRETISSENILIFSPNHVFEDYISQVLPELGEENIRRSTFADYFGNAFVAGRQTETMNQQMEYILSSNNPGDIRLAGIRFKASPRFLGALKKYVQRLEDGMGLKSKDLVYDNSLLISAEDMISLYKKQYARLPYSNRLENVRQTLFGLLEEHESQRVRDENGKAGGPESKVDYQLLKDDILQMTSFDVYSLYVSLLKDIGSFMQAADADEAEACRRIAYFTIGELENGIINYEDLAPMIYLKAVLEGQNDAGSIKHIIIDEAQDYTAVQYEIFRVVFKNCNMTILGDINQTVNGYMNVGSFDVISDTFNATDHKRIALTKSYRSSKELADFCKGLLPSPTNAEQLNRHGAKPNVIKVNSDRLYTRIADDILDLKSKGYKLIAVICKTASQCRALHQAVSARMDIGLISNQNEVYYGDVVVIPSYLAKGLEFDAVLVSSIDDKDYHMPEDRRLLYTVCTRALHELYLYYSDNMSGFISGIDEQLYTAHDLTR